MRAFSPFLGGCAPSPPLRTPLVERNSHESPRASRDGSVLPRIRMSRASSWEGPRTGSPAVAAYWRQPRQKTEWAASRRGPTLCGLRGRPRFPCGMPGRRLGMSAGGPLTPGAFLAWASEGSGRVRRTAPAGHPPRASWGVLGRPGGGCTAAGRATVLRPVYSEFQGALTGKHLSLSLFPLTHFALASQRIPSVRVSAGRMPYDQFF